jgi:hypothetical protein
LGKDIGEAFLKGLNISDFCALGLEMAGHKGDASKAKAIKVKASAPVPHNSVIKSKLKRKSTVSTGNTEPSFPPEIPYTLVKSRKKALDIVKGLIKEEIIALDLETTPLPEYAHIPKAALDPLLARPRLLQVAREDGKVYIFDLDKVELIDLPHYSKWNGWRITPSLIINSCWLWTWKIPRKSPIAP